MWPLGKLKTRTSSRKQIQIKEVRDGILCLPGNQYRIILETSSINFELRSEAEQDVLIESYQNFLNSLAGPIQIMIRVRELDIDIYVGKLEQQARDEKDPIYQKHIIDYSQFIKEVVSGNKILARSFYVVIPYTHRQFKQDFAQIKEQLALKQDIVVRGLEKLGMKAKALNSIEVLNLFYSFYNPDQVKIQPLASQLLTQLQHQSYV